MRRKLAVFVSIILVLILTFTGCGGSGGSADSGSDTIKIGWIGSLTGDQAVWGKCESQTLQMLIDQKNEEGGILGKQIELIPYDTRGDANEAVNAVKRLVSQDKVVAILGPNASGQALAISAALESAKVADIATVATNPKVTVDDEGNVKPYNFRICFIDPYQGAVCAGYAADKLGYTKAAILYDVASDYSQGFSQFFEETFKAKGGTIVAKEGFKSGDVDFRPQLSKIKAADPEVILMPYYYKEVALSANQARELGIEATFMGGDGWPSDQLMEMAGDAIEGSYLVNHLDFNDPEVKPLQDAYDEKYGTVLELNGYMVNDAFLLLTAAIEKANTTTDSDAISKALCEVEVKGVTGNIKISPETHNPDGKEAAIVKIENKNYVFQEKYGVN
ncbi:MAG: ABC transporter substrate-binding protein [Anaerovorax sp.]|nr:ABC transporter substrate-binding protein [Anaerovorax sp.]